MDIPFVYGKIADGMNFTDREEDSKKLRNNLLGIHNPTIRWNGKTYLAGWCVAHCQTGGMSSILCPATRTVVMVAYLGNVQCCYCRVGIWVACQSAQFVVQQYHWQSHCQTNRFSASHSQWREKLLVAWCSFKIRPWHISQYQEPAKSSFGQGPDRHPSRFNGNPRPGVLVLVEKEVLGDCLYPFTQKTIELKIEGELKHNFKTKVVIVTFILTVALWLLDNHLMPLPSPPTLSRRRTWRA